MTAWSIAPWLIALLAAAGLGAFGKFSDRRRRRDDEAAEAEAEQETAAADYSAEQAGYPDEYY